MATGSHSNSDESIVNFDGAETPWLSGLRNFTGLTGAMLLVGILANVYLLRMTGRSRFPVHWETARLSLRYSSVIDLSLCFAIVPIILWPWMNLHTGSNGSLPLRCARFDVNHVSFLGLVLVCSGFIVVGRQVCMFNMFQRETSLVSEHGGRTVNLLRDVFIVGAFSVVSYLFLPKFAPGIHLTSCFVDGWLTSRAVYVFPLPIAVNVVLGIVVFTRKSPPEVDAEWQYSTKTARDELSDKAIHALPLHDFVKDVEHITHSRRERLIVFAWASVVTWGVLAAAVVLLGVVLVQPPDVGTLFTVVSASAMHSAWTAFAVFRHWTKPLSGLSTQMRY